MSQLLTTDVVSPPQRAAFWTDLICATYVKLECDPLEKGSGFAGSILRHQLPGLDVSVVKSRSQRVMRTPRTISTASDDYFIVSLQTHGGGTIIQDGREAVLSPGDFAIYDSTRPYTLRFDDDFGEIVLKMRGDHLRSLVRDTHKLTATTVCGRTGAGRLLIEMINTLQTEVDSLVPASAGAVAEGIVNLLVAGLRSLPACRNVEPSTMSAYHVARIRRCIDERLQDPTLTIESIASSLHMSPGHLHRLFKSEPQSPSQYLWGRRLDQCSRDLLDPRRARASVAEIAFNWGFNDAAHFSRAFRDRFGCSPREWRASGGTRQADLVHAGDQLTAGGV
ncbi:helix-turn-helix domain-containing protein [Caldimonas sp. KR1-144]|uniref:AraC-like ligand-binding domain-containing protein n=1 Tax=Caldimonas sp. KR1-144 TaxID=3400911 RepID=UPI003C11574B